MAVASRKAWALADGQTHAHRVVDWPAFFGLAFGVLCVGSAAILIRKLDGANSPTPLAIATWRLLFAALFLAPWSIGPIRREWPGLGRRDRLLLLAAAAALAAHFALWIPSLRLTSVASSVALVTTSPIVVALLSPWLLGERVAPRAWTGIGIAFAGALALLAVPSAGSAPLAGGACPALPCPLLGKLMALAGAVAVAFYFIVRRRTHGHMGLVAYIGLVYGIAALMLLTVTVAAEGLPSGYGSRDWLLLAAIALVPQILGHGSFNWALSRLPAALVVSAVLGEPVVSTLLAWRLLGERPSSGLVAGGAAILAGILLVARSEAARPVGGHVAD
jgi:drug/metabolite transporter (DMT)-like permease